MWCFPIHVCPPCLNLTTSVWGDLGPWKKRWRGESWLILAPSKQIPRSGKPGVYLRLQNYFRPLCKAIHVCSLLGMHLAGHDRKASGARYWTVCPTLTFVYRFMNNLFCVVNIHHQIRRDRARGGQEVLRGQRDVGLVITMHICKDGQQSSTTAAPDNCLPRSLLPVQSGRPT